MRVPFFLLILFTISSANILAQITLTNKGERVFVLPGNSITIKGSYVNDNPVDIVNPQLINYGSIFISGDVTNNSPDNLFEPDGTGLIEFNGTTNQQLSGNSTIDLYRLNLNKSGNLLLQRSIVVSNQINFVSGLINLNNKHIDLGTTGVLINESNSARIFSSSGGTIKDSLISSPVITDIPGGLGLGLQGNLLSGTVIRRGHQIQSTAGDGSINRYFDLTVPATKSVQQLRMYYFDAEIPGGFTETDLVIYISYDNGNVWQKLGGTINTASNFIQLGSLNLTGNFRLTISEKDCVTPPVVDLGPANRNFCLGTIVTLDAGNPGAFYAWSIAETTQVINTSIAGNYSVIVRNARGCEGTDNITLVERPIPVANFTSGIACPAQGVPFSNASTISAGALTYAWNFGDLAVTTDVSTLQNPSYAYPLSGDYSVNLTATSAFMCAHTATKTVTVYPLPQPDFTFAKACLGQGTEFTNTSTIAIGGMTYLWDFDDASTSTAINPVRTFSGVGSFNVQLKATSNAGCIKSVTKPVQINHTPIVNFTIANACEETSISINNASSITSGTLSYMWDFGDATSGTGAIPFKSYLNPGDYTITLTAASNFNCASNISKPVTIYTNPIAAYTVANDCEDKTFTFSNSSTSVQGTLTYAWDFNEGNTSTLVNPSRIFPVAGTYDVSLQVITSFGCRNTVVHPLVVYPAPVADFTFANACPNVTIPFTNTTTISSGSSTYNWNFDNGHTSTLPNSVEAFSSSGSYDIVLKATSNQGCESLRTKTLTVYALPVLDFGSSIQTCGASYMLDALNPGSTYIWSTGSTNRVITVTSNGNYSVTLTNANGCSVSDNVSVTLHDAVLPDLGSNRSVCEGVILDAGYPGSTYIWSTGQTTRTINVIASGNYSVTVTDPNGCSGSDNVVITVHPVPHVDLGVDRAICTNTPLVLNAVNPNSAYLWSDNSTNGTLQVTTSGLYFVEVRNVLACVDRDTVNIVINDAPVNNLPATIDACDQVVLDAENTGSTYAWSTGSTQQRIIVTSSGNYSVQITSPNLCSAQFNRIVTVRPGSTVNLGPDRSICYGESVQLDAGTGNTFLWSTGAVSKTIQVRTNGIYWVVVRVANGCVKRDSVFIEVRPEIVNALPGVYNVCPNESRMLDATSPQAVSYEWFNTAGLISNDPQLNITNDGRYWVVMKDIFNCSSIDTVSIVTDRDPITARFLVATFVNTGDSVKFVQLSYPDPVLFAWDFKDGINSTESDPYHIYLRGGDFDASLMVTDPNNCSDTKSKVITVRFGRPNDELEIEVPFVEIIHSVLYPNPTAGKMKLEIELNRQTEIVISIYSVNGKFIQSKKITLKDTEVEFDVSQLAKGIYILKVTINNDERVMRFVKM